MTYRVVTLRRAEADIRAIVRWLSTKSQSGALAWLDAYDGLVGKLCHSASIYGPAAETADIDLPIKQAFFRTKRGRSYRAIFLIVDDEVRILRIRGAGQELVGPDEIV